MSSPLKTAGSAVSPGPSSTYKWKALLTVALGTMMGTMDASITNISFPVLIRTFGVPVTTIVWVTLAYLLTSTSLLLVLGRVGDLWGRKRIYVWGSLFFVLGLALCALAQNIAQLIAFRIIQAVGMAMSMACGAAIITEAFPQEERGLGMGLLAVSVSAGLIIGPVLGGFLLGWLDWRSIFYVRIPFALLVWVMALVCLKPDGPRKGRVRFDFRGTFFSSVGLASLMIGVNQLHRFGLASPIFYGLMALGLACFILFVVTEKKAPDPLVGLTLFSNRAFSGAVGGLFMMFLTYSAYILLMPFYLLQGAGLRPDQAGVMMTVVSMIAIFVGPISGRLSDRFGAAGFATLGAAVTILAFFLFTGWTADTTLRGMLPALVLAGLGMGMFQSPNNSSIMGAVPKDRLGTASAMIATSRQVGISLGTALAGTVYSSRLFFHRLELGRQGMQGTAAERTAVSLAFNDAFWVSAVLMISVVFLSLMTRRVGKGGQGAGPASGKDGLGGKKGLAGPRT